MQSQTAIILEFLPIIAVIVGGLIGIAGSLVTIWWTDKKETRKEKIKWYEDLRRIAREIAITRRLNQETIQDYDPTEAIDEEVRELFENVRDTDVEVDRTSILERAAITSVEELEDRFRKWQESASQQMAREMEFLHFELRNHAASHSVNLSDELREELEALIVWSYRDTIHQMIPVEGEVEDQIEESAKNVIDQCETAIEDIEGESALGQ